MALDPYVERAIPSPAEKLLTGKDMMEWGERNQYPEFLLKLYADTPTLRTIINGTKDFITGNGTTFGKEWGSAEPLDEQVDGLAFDAMVFGGFALQVIRSKSGEVVETYRCPVRYLRMNKEGNVFYYSEKWHKPGAKKVITYPAFMPIDAARWATLSPEERERNTTSILFVKTAPAVDTYPAPVYAAAVKACKTECSIDDYHLNAIENGFVSSMIVNFNAGVPDDETKALIEKEFNEKFTGSQNAGRVMFSWNSDRTNATTITEPKIDNFGDRYQALANHVRQQIFTAFRANPNLFGIPTENLGFSQEEYESAFRLYNRTMVRPVQSKICRAYEAAFNMQGILTISPFSIDEGAVTDKNVD